MARKAIWRGVVTFGAARVPVKLYSAVREHDVEFRLLHDQDEVPLRGEMVCESDEKPVPQEERVKALRIDEEKYVIIEPSELDELAPESDRDIQVMQFVDAAQVDCRYFDRPYYLGPDGEEDKYASLVAALKEAGVVGICQWVFRKRSYSGQLQSSDGILELISLRLKNELTDAKDLQLPKPKLSQPELKTGRYLIDELSGTFDPAHYRDDFHDKLAKLIQVKSRGGHLKLHPAQKAEPTESMHLLKTLEASLSKARQGKRRLSHAR